MSELITPLAGLVHVSDGAIGSMFHATYTAKHGDRAGTLCGRHLTAHEVTREPIPAALLCPTCDLKSRELVVIPTAD